MNHIPTFGQLNSNLDHTDFTDWSPLIYNESLDTYWHVDTSIYIAVGWELDLTVNTYEKNTLLHAHKSSTYSLVLTIFQTEHAV